MTPDEYCQQKAAASGSSFYYSFLFLPPERRRAITALYAYCREIDDVVDEVSDPGVAQAKLAWWAGEIDALYAGRPGHPVTRALAPHVATFDLKRERLLQVLEGMQMDLQQTRYLDFAGLQRYCHLVAGVVGELAAGIFGAAQESTYEYARQLGLALQLVNIVRDVGEDARRGRIYLPLEDLQRFGVRAADLLAGRYAEGFEPLMRFEAERARGFYRAALAALAPEERKAQRPGLIMGAIYATLLDEIERERFRVLHQRIALTPLRKLWIAWRTWVFPPAIGRPGA
ncbi:presqualene diphosphate synthase HpnD [Betaproteobacteria bacterium PRO7]|jgi:phytoene synthase|nr:presqualene diphosphate synthase HpnD [Burkholderiaceae bacterium]MDL1860095.1 presqualene diphosphate synthase HpnD [Betaproteobacteria bacterium PRO7]GIL04490.1 MAG: phytoene synthase [Betaproteobacteria bacterium]